MPNVLLFCIGQPHSMSLSEAGKRGITKKGPVAEAFVSQSTEPIIGLMLGAGPNAALRDVEQHGSDQQEDHDHPAQ